MNGFLDCLVTEANVIECYAMSMATGVSLLSFASWMRNQGTRLDRGQRLWRIAGAVRCIQDRCRYYEYSCCVFKSLQSYTGLVDKSSTTQHNTTPHNPEDLHVTRDLWRYYIERSNSRWPTSLNVIAIVIGQKRLIRQQPWITVP